jgi:hypothetical protein
MRVNKWLLPTLALILMLGTVGVAQANGWWIVSGKEMVNVEALTGGADVKGWMTLQQVADGVDIDTATLYAQLGLSADIPPETALKDLEKIVDGFEVGVVREVVDGVLGNGLAAATEPAVATATPAVTTAAATLDRRPGIEREKDAASPPRSKNASGTPPTSSAPTPGSSAQEYSGPSSASSSCASPKSGLPPSAPSWRRPAPPPAAAAAWMNPPPTTPRASSTCPPEARFDYLLNCPEAETSARRSTPPCATSRSTTRSSPASCPRPTTSSPAPSSRNCSRRSPRFPPALDYDAFGRIYEYFLGEFAMTEGQGRRVLHPQQHRPPAHRGHRALPRAHPRPRVRLGRHVRAVRALRGRAQEEPRRRTRHLRRREDRRDRPPLPPEPGRPRPGGRHPPRRQRQQLLRRPARRHGPLRLRPRQPAVQRQRRGQGAAEGHGRAGPPLPLRPAAHRQRQLPVDSALLLRAQGTSSGRGGRAGFVMANSASDARSSEQDIRQPAHRRAAPWT